MPNVQRLARKICKIFARKNSNWTILTTPCVDLRLHLKKNFHSNFLDIHSKGIIDLFISFCQRMYPGFGRNSPWSKCTVAGERSVEAKNARITRWFGKIFGNYWELQGNCQIVKRFISVKHLSYFLMSFLHICNFIALLMGCVRLRLSIHKFVFTNDFKKTSFRIETSF